MLKESDANFPDQNVQRCSVTSLETARSLANGPSWGLLEKYVFCVPRELQRFLSPFVYGRILWAELDGGGEILFTGRQSCSLYLVLWLCASNYRNHPNIRDEIQIKSVKNLRNLREAFLLPCISNALQFIGAAVMVKNK